MGQWLLGEAYWLGPPEGERYRRLGLFARPPLGRVTHVSAELAGACDEVGVDEAAR